MLSFLRTSVVRSNTASENPVYYEDGKSYFKMHGPEEQYSFSNRLCSSKSFCNPPLHLHLFQTEDFRVEEGTAVFEMPYATDLSKRVTVATSPTGIAHIPVRAAHTFRNSSGTEPLTVQIRLQPADRDQEESFFRNFFGYLEDSRKAGMEPSIFQVFRFLYENDTVPVVPIPGPDLLRLVVGYLLLFVVGKVVGEMLLGYKGTYLEYYKKGTK